MEIDVFVHSENNHQTGKQIRNGKKDKTLQIREILDKREDTISVFNQTDAQNLFHKSFISCLYMFRAHMLIIRRSKLHYTASGIITLIGVIRIITTIGVMIPEAV